MTRILSILFLLSFPVALFGQLGNNGALISVKDGAFMSVHEEVVNYNGGTFHNTDTIYLFDDWTNIAGNEAFISLGVGVVHLYGDDQRIKGTDITRFYDLRLEQTGVKYGDIDVYVDGFLRLNDRQFHMDTNCVSVFNPDIPSVENIGLGYVSALEDGGLLRATNTTDPYFYPVGWPNYYRPAELTMNLPDPGAFKVRMAFTDATAEGFDRNLREPTLCDVIPTFYHRISRASGSNDAQVKLHYDPAVDGDWNTLVHWQNIPQWEDTGDETAGIEPISGLSFFESVPFISDFTFPAFALGNNSDTIPLMASDTIICEGDIVTFSGEPGYIFYEFFQNGVSVYQGPNNSYTTSDIEDGDVFSFNGTANECIYFGSSIVMTVNDLPVATASNNSPICPFETLELSVNASTSYEWTGPNGFTSNLQNPTIPFAEESAEGTYQVILGDVNGCRDTATTEVVIHPKPEASITNNSPVCEGDEIQINASVHDSYSWTGPSGFTSADQNISINPATPANGGTYLLIVSNEFDCTDTVSTEIIVNTLPPATADNSGPVCQNVDFQLLGSGGTDYQWSGPDGYSNTEQSPIVDVSVNPILPGDYTYTVTVTDGNSCVATASTTVTINPLPTPTASNNGPLCLGDELQLFASDGVTHTWNGPESFGSLLQNPTLANPDFVNAGTYTVIVTDMNGCTGEAETIVEILALPNVMASSNSPVCENETILLEGVGATSYAWSGPDGFSSNLQSPQVPNAGQDNAGTYSVIGTDDNGCSNAASVDVIVNTLPEAMASNDSPVCPGSNVNLTASGGDFYEWSGPNGFSANIQNTAVTGAQTINEGIYTVTVTDGNGCTSTAQTILELFDPPAETIANDSPACEGDDIQFSLTGDPNWDYSWSGPNGFTSNEQNPGLSDVLENQGGIYSVTITDDNGCLQVLTTPVLISTYPELSTSVSAPVCVGGDIQIQTSVGTDWIYDWTGPNGFIDSVSNPLLEDVTLDDEGFYYVEVMNATGCTSYDTVFVQLLEPVMAEVFADTTIFDGGSADLYATENDGYMYSWSPPESLDCSNCPTVVATPTGTTVYTVTITNEDGCSQEFEVLVEVEKREDDELVVPNAITPNGDGKNEEWVIPWLFQFPENDVVILNRWGDEVYYSKPYENDFNGTYEGRELPAGTYYYILRLGEDFTVFKGPLTIIRE